MRVAGESRHVMSCTGFQFNLVQNIATSPPTELHIPLHGAVRNTPIASQGTFALRCAIYDTSSMSQIYSTFFYVFYLVTVASYG